LLYYSDEFKVAGHLCPCGCGNKVITPIGPVDWSFKEHKGRATLYPSIGNWQLPCRSHYWISEGEIKWSYQWSEEEILAGRKAEENRRNSYFEERALHDEKPSLFWRIINWLFKKSRE
jgi:hypothetical protein